MGQNRMRKVEKGDMNFLLHIYSLRNLCRVYVGDIYSTMFHPFTPKGLGYLRKNLAAEAKQAIRAAVSWSDAIRALWGDEGRD